MGFSKNLFNIYLNFIYQNIAWKVVVVYYSFGYFFDAYRVK